MYICRSFCTKVFFVQYVYGKVNLLIRKNILLQNNEYIFSKTHKKMFNARREEKMFTRMSKGVLWVLVAAVVIGGFVGMAEEVGIGLLIWLGDLS